MPDYTPARSLWVSPLFWGGMMQWFDAGVGIGTKLIGTGRDCVLSWGKTCLWEIKGDFIHDLVLVGFNEG